MCASTGQPSGAVTTMAGSGVDGSCVGITIPIPEPLAGALESWRASFGDPMAAVVPPHITLITTTPASDWDATIDHVRAVARAQRPFEVRLRSTGSFRPVSPVVFLKLVEGFDECVELHARLQTGPLERDLDFPFHPHVTVAHDVSEAGMDAAVEELHAFEASFEVRSMGLYEHVPSGLWKLREELHFGEVADGSEAAAG
ncbi:2'-5' RNA ligase family protein [Arthrobacter sp. MDT1-48-3]